MKRKLIATLIASCMLVGMTIPVFATGDSGNTLVGPWTTVKGSDSYGSVDGTTADADGMWTLKGNTTSAGAETNATSGTHEIYYGPFVDFSAVTAENIKNGIEGSILLDFTDAKSGEYYGMEFAVSDSSSVNLSNLEQRFYGTADGKVKFDTTRMNGVADSLKDLVFTGKVAVNLKIWKDTNGKAAAVVRISDGTVTASYNTYLYDNATSATQIEYDAIGSLRYGWVYNIHTGKTLSVSVPTFGSNEPWTVQKGNDSYGFASPTETEGQWLLRGNAEADSDGYFTGPFIDFNKSNVVATDGYQFDASIDLSTVKAGDNIGWAFGVNKADGNTLLGDSSCQFAGTADGKVKLAYINDESKDEGITPEDTVFSGTLDISCEVFKDNDGNASFKLTWGDGIEVGTYTYKLLTSSGNSWNPVAYTSVGGPRYAWLWNADVDNGLLTNSIPSVAAPKANAITNFSADGKGSVTATLSSAKQGTEITLTAQAEKTYQLKAGSLKYKKTDDATDAGTAITDSKFTMPNYPVTIVAEFEKIPVTGITISKPDSSNITPSTDYQCVAVVSPETADPTLKWTVSGGTGSTINASTGLLKVSNEAAGTVLTITATSTVTNTISATKKLTVDDNGGSEPEVSYYSLTLVSSPAKGGAISAKVEAGNTYSNNEDTNVFQVEAGKKIQLTTTPDGNYELKNMTAQGVTLNGKSFTMPQNEVTVTAVFTEKKDPEVNYYDLTLVSTPTEGGKVSAKVDGGNTYSNNADTKVFKVESGKLIQLTATPNSNYEFKSITANGVKLEGKSFTMPKGAVTITATFTGKQTPPVTPDDKGEEKPVTPPTGDNSAEVVFPESGKKVVIPAGVTTVTVNGKRVNLADTIMKLAGKLSDTAVNSAVKESIKANLGSTVTANILDLFEIVLKDKSGNVLVNPTFEKPFTILTSVPYNAAKEYHIFSSNDGKTFKRETGRVTKVNGFVSFTTSHFTFFSVVEAEKSTPVAGGGSSYGRSSGGASAYYITASAGLGGKISPEGETKVKPLENFTYTVTPDKGYAVDKVLVDKQKEVSLTDGTYTFKNVSEPYTIHVTFKKTDASGQTGTGTPSPVAPPAPNPATGDSIFAHLFDSLQ